MYTQPSISPTIQTAALAGLEVLLNKALEMDLSSQLKLQKLNGHVFHFHCNAPELSFYLLPGSDKIRICGFFDAAADTTLKGSAADFMKLAKADNSANALINGNLELQGDSHALIALQTIARELELDWEAPIARLFGDIAGHQIGKNIRQGVKFGKNLMQSARRQVGDFLVEESELLAPRWQLEKFYSEVDQLNLSTERLEARLNKILNNKHSEKL